MNRFVNTIRKPVKRQGAEQYILITLLSFAASVSFTRLFLSLTGYPQLGGGTLHIAHLLWGGLLLFVASLLPLIFANRWVYSYGAVLAGIGVGLFIDEVGKFITQSNDYFYPGAAPIIYAFFLLTVLLYLQVRRPPSRDPRTELYNAFEALEDVLDHDLDERERAELENRLKFVAGSNNPDLARLAKELLHFLNNKKIYIAPAPKPFWQRWLIKAAEVFDRVINRSRFRFFLSIGVGVLGVVAISQLGQLILASASHIPLQQAVTTILSVNLVTGPRELNWFLARLGLEASIGILLMISSALLATGKDKIGITTSYLGLLISLTVIDLLIFYFNQFSTIITALFQFGVLLGVLYYRRRYILDRSQSDRAESS